VELLGAGGTDLRGFLHIYDFRVGRVEILGSSSAALFEEIVSKETQVLFSFLLA
jgi:hypothetical protein